MIPRRHIRLVIALLLPLMVMRAMLPAGYMPVAENGKLRMVMCSAGLQLPGADQNNTGKHPAPEHSGNCLFAHSAVGAPAVQYLVATIDPPAELRFLTPAADELPPATGPPRAASARAPPVLS